MTGIKVCGRPRGEGRPEWKAKEKAMANTPHTLQEEFPGEAAKISALKGSDAHFARLL